MRNINNSLLYRLNPEEQKQCLEVINNMIASGFCTYEKDTLECLRLTDKKYEGLYPKKVWKSLKKLSLIFSAELTVTLAKDLWSDNYAISKETSIQKMQRHL